MQKIMVFIVVIVGLILFSSLTCKALSYEASAGLYFTALDRADNLWGYGHRSIKSIFSKPESQTVFRVFPAVDLRIFPDGSTGKSPGKYKKSEIYISTQDKPGNIVVGSKINFGKSSINMEGFYAFFARNWQNPYALYRTSTTTMNGGGSIAYTNIMDTGLAISYKYAITNLDKDLTWMISRDLRQDGRTHTASLVYRRNITRNVEIAPEFCYERGDFDGKSNSYDSLIGAFGINMKNTKMNINARIYGQSTRYDKVNPLYGKKRDETGYGGRIYAVFPEPFGCSKISIMAGVMGNRTNANITFYDKYSIGILTGIVYNF